MPRYTFIKYNDGEPDADMLADTAGIDCDVCKNCHDGIFMAVERRGPMWRAADVLFHEKNSDAPKYWASVAEMAEDGSPDAWHPEYGEASEMDADMYRCGLCNVTIRSRDNSKAHYTT